MDKKPNPSWLSFMSSKQEGGVRNANMSSFIQKSNVFQNEVQNTEPQQIKLGKLPTPDDPIKSHVEFRSEPLRPKQTEKERDMWVVAKPLIQEYTTLNIVKEPTIQPYTHRISADLHNNLNSLIKKSENLTMEKKSQTVVPRKGESNQQKIINERFLEQIRKTDQSVSPLRQNFTSLNQYVPGENSTVKEPNKLQNTYESRKDLSFEKESSQKSKYDKEFNFKQFAQNRVQSKGKQHLIDFTLPTTIQEIMSLKNLSKQQLQQVGSSLTSYEYATLPQDEYLFMEDMVERSNFDKKMRAQSVEQNQQVLKLNQPSENNSKQDFTYDTPQPLQRTEDLDINQLDFNQIIQIASGTVNPEKFKGLSMEIEKMSKIQSRSQINYKSNNSSNNESIAIPAASANKTIPQQTSKFEIPKTRIETKQSDLTTTIIQEAQDDDENDDENDDEEYNEDNLYANKCVGTTPRPDQVNQRDESVQISSLKIDEDLRNIPRVGVILNQIKQIKAQYHIAAERLDRVKIKYLLNHRLVDLMNLIMLNEQTQVKTIGEAVQYLLSQKKQKLSEQNIDGISKLELFYIFLTEYKNYKTLTDDDSEDSFTLVKEDGQLRLIPKNVGIKKTTKGNKMVSNRKDFNSLAYHFRSSPKQSDSENGAMIPRYLQNTQSNQKKMETTPKNQKKFSSPKTLKTTKKKHPSVRPFEEEGHWIRRNDEIDEMGGQFGWTKII